MSQKGNQYEREVCRKLSEWWSPGRSDIFWRTKGSGGRATRRSRTGRGATAFQHGDIYATDPSGLPLLDLVTIELKRGYSKTSIQDLVDRPPPRGSEQQAYDAFLQQTIEAAEAAGSFAWLMIVRKNKRQALVFMPEVLVSELKKLGCFFGKPIPFLTIIAKVRFRYLIGKSKSGNKKYKVTERKVRTSCMLLEKWLECVTPSHIKELLVRN